MSHKQPNPPPSFPKPPPPPDPPKVRNPCPSCAVLQRKLEDGSARLALLEKAISDHKSYVWGTKKPEHDADIELYRAYLKEGK